MVRKMKKIVVASTHKEAGKTSIIIGLSKILEEKGKSIGYMKPIGDRLLYQKKRLWDYDAALVSSILDLTESPENISIGFDHTKLQFMYDEQSTKKKMTELFSKISKEKDIVFIESGENLAFGYSVFLDALTVARTIGAKMILVLSGENRQIIDDICFLRKCVLSGDIDLLGVVINRVKDPSEFKSLHLDTFEQLGVDVLGIIPYEEEMTRFTIDYLNQTLFSKIIAGEEGLMNIVHRVFVGAMSAAQVVNKPLWQLENKLIITPGDRSDMIIAALESSTAGIVLTNNILPDDPIIQSMADSRKIPILLMAQDTFAIAKLIDDMEILFTKDENQKIQTLQNLVKENIEIDHFL
jgi:BioD-like phosphotransacetylase family protein